MENLICFFKLSNQMKDMGRVLIERIDRPLRCQLAQYEKMFSASRYISYPHKFNCTGCEMILIRAEGYDAQAEHCTYCEAIFCNFECAVCETHHNCADKRLVLRYDRNNIDSCCKKCYFERNS